MKSTVTFLVLLALCCLVDAQWAVDPTELPRSPNASHTCSMWGVCYHLDGFDRNCEYTERAPLLLHDGLSQDVKDQLLDILENRCPFLLYDENDNRKPDDQIFTCCDAEQLVDMAANFLLADGVLGRCPACVRNYVRQICEMNCSPEQSRFVDVYTAPTPEGYPYVVEVDYRMHEEFMLNAHTACAGVLVPQTGQPAINVMCGNAAVCDADAWFAYSGDVENNPFIATQVNFLRWPTPEDSMNAQALSCNETYRDDIPCSCVDCLVSCPSGIEPVIPEICKVGTINCIGFSVGLSFFVISVTIFMVLTLIDYKNMRNVEQSKPLSSKNIKKRKVLIKFFQIIFSSIGSFSARYPMPLIMCTSWVAFAMFFGVTQVPITANPINLWSSPDSRSRADFDYFNSRFGPFYRTSQVFLQFKALEPFSVDNTTYGPAYRLEALRELVALEEAIINLGRDTGDVTWEQVCYAPLRSRGSPGHVDLCVIMSASTYLGSDRNDINNATYLNRILNCMNNVYNLECLASWGGGSEPEIAFGGYEATEILSADTLVVNLPLANYLNAEDLRPVKEWEQMFLEFMIEYKSHKKPDYVDVFYAAERSIEDEIERVSQAEAVPIAISYILMFIYVTLALGRVKSYRQFLYGSKVIVAIGSILIVVLAIFCALGLMGYLGIETTLLAINVIPFFVLSVGIDNVFLMVNTLYEIQDKLKEFEEYNENFSLKKKKLFIFEKMMAKIGPSIFVTSLTQITCFAIGTTSNFPAVSTFAVFATFSLSFLFFFQMTSLVALLSLDYDRESNNGLDIFCCIRKKMLDDNEPLTSGQPYRNLTERLMVPYSNFILDWRVKIIVAIIFMGILSTSTILIPQLEVGLDQQMALPKDSYVYSYLESVANLFKLGPPVYFVLKAGLNFTDPVHQNAICGGRLCNDDSLISQIFLASLYSDVTFISRSSNSWLDDFFDWSTLRYSCCKYNVEDNSFCQSTNTSSVCSYCEIELDDNGIRPLAEGFERYIPFFLQDEPTESCNKGGLASYFSSVNYLLDEEGRATVHDTNFMAYHNGLSTSSDYITAVKYGYEISENITAAIRRNTGVEEVEVFPYSVFYPFFEGYLTMWWDTLKAIGFSFIGVIVITLLTSGLNLLTSFAILFTALMVVVNMMGVMYIWNIPLNAVSLVNLIVSIGIAVEFCGHIIYAFATSTVPPRERVADAIRQVGGTIITGITFTNIPVIVLAFSYTEIIEVFFFRMFFSLVLIGFFHGMVFLPVFLSFLVNAKYRS